MRKRETNFELLRIVSMCMIIALHYMSKGMAVPKLFEEFTIANFLWWLVYAFCVVAPNSYVLISGYFLSAKYADGDWNVKDYIMRGIRILAEVLFYSWIIPIVLCAFGFADISTLSFDEIITIALPIEHEHYWFAASYFLMYLVSPILGAAIKKLSKQQLGGVIAASLTVFSLLKSVNPYLISWDRYGCDFAWFVVLFLIAGYIREYGIPVYKDLKTSVRLYLLCVFAIGAYASLVAWIVGMTGKLEYFYDMIYSYNHIFVLAASVSFFYIFKHICIKESRIIMTLASCTFGVYLLHENLLLRNNWYRYLGIEGINGELAHALHMLICIVVVFAIGTIVDMLRQGIFRVFRKK